MRVSVVMNTLNEKPEYLIKAIESYLNQVGVEVELIVSTVKGDKSVKLIKDNYPDVKIVTLTKKEHSSNGERSPIGAYLQLNNALKHVTGKYFCYASSNDYAKPNKLMSESNILERTNKKICYSAFEYVTDSGEITNRFRVREYDYASHLIGNFVSDCSMISTELLRKYTPFDLSVKNLGFWDMWLRVYKGEGDVFVNNPKPTWCYRQHKTSMRAIRLADPEKQKQELADREEMLNRHR